jgi:hypothetical protein
MIKKLAPCILLLAICLGCWKVLAGDAANDNPQALEATTYQIRNVKHDELLRPRDANNANGTPIVLYQAQPWKCMTWRLQAAGDSAFHLKNLFTSKTFCADTNTDNPRQKVTQLPLPKDGEVAPTWQFVRLDDGSYRIADSNSGKVLTAIPDGLGEYKIVMDVWQNLDEQKWRLEKIDPQDLTM